MKTYEGGCFCGAVQITVSGEPEAMGYCHCESCRHWSASPINAFTLWKPESVKITKGESNLGTFHKTERSGRRWCKSCGGHVFTDHPLWKLVDVYPAVLRGFPYKPGVHVHYGEKMVSLRDGLPKMKDLPKEMGGSGETVPE